MSVQGLATDAGYNVGVVLTDIAHRNYILSEGLATGAAYTTGGTTAVAVTLKPVVATAYLVGPSLNTSTLTNLSALTYQFTVYPADELGYVIPSNSAAVTPFDGQALTVAQFPAVTAVANTNVLFAPVTSALTGYGPGTLNPIPTGGTATAVLSATSNSTAVIAPSAGNVYTAGGGAVTIGAPAGGLPNQGPVYSAGSIYKAGVPVTAEAATVALGGTVPTGPVAVSAYLTSTVSAGQAGTIPGYTYQPGVNFPTGSATPYAVGTPITLNLAPGLYPIIQ